MLTKMDGDARGGAALSIYGVTKKPIKYIGVGEKPDALEEFHPDRMAGRILQQGDIVTLVEKAQDAFDADEAKKLEKKVRKEGMDLNDFLAAMKQIEKLGPLEGVLKLLPGREHQDAQAGQAGRSAAHEAHRGDRALDDGGGAEGTRHHERLAPGPGGEGERPPHLRGQPPARAVPRDEEDDEDAPPAAGASAPACSECASLVGRRTGAAGRCPAREEPGAVPSRTRGA